MRMFKKVAELFIKKQKIEKEIAKIQKSCNHSKKSIKNIRERVDSTITVTRWVCNICSKIVGYPSDKERKDFFKE